MLMPRQPFPWVLPCRMIQHQVPIDIIVAHTRPGGSPKNKKMQKERPPPLAGSASS
jgi:hypothetical protein